MVDLSAQDPKILVADSSQIEKLPSFPFLTKPSAKKSSRKRLMGYSNLKFEIV